jgi:type I site-specific restriction endonuclease
MGSPRLAEVRRSRAAQRAEVAGRHGTADYRRRLEPENQLHNDGLPKVALKMATGTGKTVVIAMIIAWQATRCRRALR